MFVKVHQKLFLQNDHQHNQNINLLCFSILKLVKIPKQVIFNNFMKN